MEEILSGRSSDIEPQAFTSEWLLVCEGIGDKNFFQLLLEQRPGLPRFDVHCPTKDGKYAGGRGNFGRYLSSIALSESFLKKTKGVLLVSDSDEDHDSSFVEVIGEIRKSKVFGVPNAPWQRAAATNEAPALAVYMIPPAGPGNIETICLPAAWDKWHLEAATNAFVDQTPAHAWSDSKKAKAKMHCVLATTNEARPDVGFATHWKQDANARLETTHHTFDAIADMLAGFPALIAQ